MMVFLWISIAFMLNIGVDEECAQGMKKYKYLALGDSYTIGEAVNMDDRFPVQLTSRLQQEGFEVENPQIIAKTGWTTDELLKGITEISPEDDFDLVTLLIGVNNQYRGRDLANYETEFEVVLRKAIDFAGGNKNGVIVISIPDYGVTPFAEKKGSAKISSDIDKFNTINKNVSDRHGIEYINITDISRTAAQNSSLIADDGLHPSAEMYALWTGLIVPAAIDILNQRDEE